MHIQLSSVILGAALGVAAGARGRGLVKAMARGLLAVEETATGWMGGVREGLRDAVEEARYEREQMAEWRELRESRELAQEMSSTSGGDATDEESTATPGAAAAAPRRNRSRKAPADRSV